MQTLIHILYKNTRLYLTCFSVDNHNIETTATKGSLSSVDFDVSPSAPCKHAPILSVFESFTADSYINKPYR